MSRHLLGETDERILAKAYAQYLGEESIVRELDRLPCINFQSDVLNRLIKISMECRVTNKVSSLEVYEAYIQEGGEGDNLYDFIREDELGILLTSDIKLVVNRVLQALEADKIAEALEDYRLGRIQREDLASLLEDYQEGGYARTLLETLEELERTDLPPGLPTGFPLTDTYSKGLRRSRMSILAARPGVGKSDLAVAITRNVLEEGEGVYLASLEMDRLEIVERMVAGNRTKDTLLGYPGKLFIDDRANLTVPQIAAASQAKEVSLVIVDYLQILNLQQSYKGQYERVTLLSNQLRIAAKHSSAAWLVLSQLSRNARDEHKAPVLSDLRESGAIEQDAFAVFFLHEPDPRDYDSDQRGVQLTIAKNRRGVLAAIQYMFKPAVSAWRER